MINKDSFGEWFKKEVETRWSKCNFSWTEIGDWHWRLRDFEIDTLTQAVRRHKVCEDYRQPSLKKVYKYAQTITAHTNPKRERRDGASGKSTGIPDEHTFIMCVAKSDNGCGCVGWFVPILIWPFTKTYTPETYRHTAEQQRVMHSHNGRNGVWEIFYGTTHGEMLRRSNKLTHTKPLDLNQLRKRYKIKPKP